MKLHIANYYDAPRFTAVAGQDLNLGAVIKIDEHPTLRMRRALRVNDADAALLNPGRYGVAFKVSSDPLQVSASSLTAAQLDDLGDRAVKIRSGDMIVECREGTILEYDVSLLHSSITAAIAAGTALGVKDGQFCTSGTAGAITSPVVGRVYEVRNGKILIELVSQ